MKTIFKFCICFIAIMICSSCREKIQFTQQQNKFVIKKIETAPFTSGKCKYYLNNIEVNNGNDMIKLIDTPNKYQYNDTLSLIKIN